MKNETISNCNLRGFIGTDNYYQASGTSKRHLLTDGTKFLAEKCQCYWLFDLIASYYSKYKNEEMFFLDFIKETNTVSLYKDKNNKSEYVRVIAQQKIDLTDFWEYFAETKLKLYIQKDHNDNWIIFLPSEY